MNTAIPRLRPASEVEMAGLNNPENPPRDFIFHDCVIVQDPVLKIQIAYYDRDLRIHTEQAPLFSQEIFISTTNGATFSTLWPQDLTMIQSVAEKEAKAWSLGLAGLKGIEYIRLTITDAW